VANDVLSGHEIDAMTELSLYADPDLYDLVLSAHSSERFYLSEAEKQSSPASDPVGVEMREPERRLAWRPAIAKGRTQRRHTK